MFVKPCISFPKSGRGPRKFFTLFVLVTVGLFACSSSSTDSSLASPTEDTAACEGQGSLVPGTSWQWQLSGDIDTSVDAQMYDIDLFDAPQAIIDELHAKGRVVICYFSAGSWEDWRSDAGQFSAEVLGKTLDDWPDEKWLDIRQLDILGPLMQARLDLAVQKRCDGVEPDNVDAYANNTGFPLTYQDQLTYNMWLADEAHARGLSIGLKNDLDQVQDLVTHFDWALNEQCFQYNECEALLPFVQSCKAVFGVEYEGNPEEYCPKANALNFDWLYKNWDLDAWRQRCR
nr:putative endo alpha-1,4 polygalactosaminidase [uncultured bacterium]